MNKENYIIPEEITFYYPKKLGKVRRIEGFDKLPDVLPAAVCNKKDTSIKKSKVKYNLACVSGYQSTYNWYYVKDGEEEILGEITIKNNSFNISLIPSEISEEFLSQCCSDWGNNLGYRTRLFPVIIDSPEILSATNGKRLMVLSRCSDFFQALLENPYIIDGKIRGTYNLSFTTQFPGLVELRLVDTSNHNYNQAKEKGYTVAKKKTSKWIPGHLYTKGNGNSFIYLGEFQNIIVDRRYGTVESFVSLRENSNILNSCNDHRKFKMGKVFINFPEDDEVSEFKDNYEGAPLIEFIKLNLLDQNTFSGSLRCRDSYKSPVTAVDMGEVLVYDNNLDINAVLKQMTIDQLQSFTKLSEIPEEKRFLLSYYPEFVESGKIDEYLDLYLEKMKKEILGIGNYFYYRTPRSTTPATAESIRSNLNWYFSDILSKTVFNISDSKINDILTKVADYYNEQKNLKKP